MSDTLITGINRRPRISPTLWNALIELASTGGAFTATPKPAKPPEPKALINRCACGQRISDRRSYCRECFEIALDLVIRGEASPTTTQLVLDQSTAEQRMEIIRRKQAEQAVTELAPDQLL
jgi:hypothetical protein